MVAAAHPTLQKDKHVVYLLVILSIIGEKVVIRVEEDQRKWKLYIIQSAYRPDTFL